MDEFDPFDEVRPRVDETEVEGGVGVAEGRRGVGIAGLPKGTFDEGCVVTVALELVVFDDASAEALAIAVIPSSGPSTSSTRAAATVVVAAAAAAVVAIVPRALVSLLLTEALGLVVVDVVGASLLLDFLGSRETEELPEKETSWWWRNEAKMRRVDPPFETTDVG